MFTSVLRTPLSYAKATAAVAAPSPLAQAADVGALISAAESKAPRFLAAAATEAVKEGPMGKIVPFSAKYFVACSIGGILSCGLTHTAITPLDLVKCNMQANPEKYTGIVQGFRVFLKEKASLSRGWAPTLLGYSAQGLHKFGLYELFKHYYGQAIGEENASQYKSLLYCAASGSAEFFADIALCPFEAVKVRVQTDPTFANGLMDGMPKIVQAEGINGLFKGLVPLWARQIPYTIIKFVAFEKVVSLIYAALPGEKADYSYNEQLGITFLAGYIAGVFCAIVSHPADTMVSKLNKVASAEGEGMGAAMSKIYADIGFAGLWRGLVARVFMIGTLTGLQWWIYDSFKVFVGLPTTGSVEKKKEN
ncbi:uncharacterized protein AMSG_05289 [Thecamonas trahens ATCC 50062]|uniref:Phosphate carrier protein n=1 Tax=Thecamonas trahens ATCC 50062 TaxID=461836 RepID=A0A0L0DAC3_THETB|nr:hypothetical protein AMSG_05289 [Thecamonas trahens ATCC 50062]KNC49292.1 hypothetical protein AMSG_05289 [Thecamonas trahens ATCC 50062]|eukprot:XP_013758005.1 hypothetical protein AMSG_05289 [Thecamonas trahens ATCC 50062]